MKPINWSRAIVATLVAFVVTQLAFVILFGNPAVQAWYYTTAAGQSEKFAAVWNTLQPLPSLSANWAKLADASARTYAVMGLLLIWTFLLVIVYAVVAPCLPGTGWRKGISSGAMIWAIAFVWFATFSHFNVLNMPLGHVIGEWVLEAIICVVGGIAIALVYKPVTP
jgi:hypothetical protein